MGITEPPEVGGLNHVLPFTPPNKHVKLAIVSDFPAYADIELGIPLQDYRGNFLWNMMTDAGLTHSDCFITTVLNFRPITGRIESICADKKTVTSLLGSPYTKPPIAPGRYVRPEYFSQLDRLKEELESVKPNLVLTLGNFPLWALCGTAGIETYRGTVMESTLVPWLKVLPLYSPAAVMADYSKRVIAIADLMKAKREQEVPYIVRPERLIHIAETLDDLENIRIQCTLRGTLAVDIETNASTFISCISFSPDSKFTYVIPFIAYDGRTRSPYWEKEEDELAAWSVVEHILCTQRTEKVFQNGLYDLQFLFKCVKIRPRNVRHDTMLAHHALYSELPKGLGFLGSIYTNEIAWKQLRPRGKTAGRTKREE